MSMASGAGGPAGCIIASRSLGLGHTTGMKISDIYVHDAQLHRIIEDIEADTLTMEVQLPILERDEQQEPRLVVFDDAYNYRVFEGPWDGLVTILNMHVVGEQGRWHHVRIETNAGYRELFCTGVRVLEDDHVA
jgi:hypothetical protein